MKLHQDGDKGRAICRHCESIVDTTFKRRDVPFSDGIGMARDILVSVCDICQETVGIPAQSTPAINAARKIAEHPVEAKVPPVFVDALDLACFELSKDATPDLRKRLITFYIHKYASGDFKPNDLSSLLEQSDKIFPTRRGVSGKRLSFKVDSTGADEINSLLTLTRLKKTELLKSVIFKIKEDILDRKGKKVFPELKSLVFGH